MDTGSGVQSHWRRARQAVPGNKSLRLPFIYPPPIALGQGLLTGVALENMGYMPRYLG